MSQAKTQFEESIKDAEELLAHFDATKPTNGGLPPKPAEVLKRAGLILAMTAWETYIEDRVRESLDAKLANTTGTHAADFMSQRFEEEIKRFHNPNSEKTARLSQDYIGQDVTKAWTYNPGGNAEAKKRLNAWVKRRGEAAHRSPASDVGKPSSPHLVTRDELRKLINFLKSLVDQTEAALK